jgi:hypothetical protein
MAELNQRGNAFQDGTLLVQFWESGGWQELYWNTRREWVRTVFARAR